MTVFSIKDRWRYNPVVESVAVAISVFCYGGYLRGVNLGEKQILCLLIIIIKIY